MTQSTTQVAPTKAVEPVENTAASQPESTSQQGIVIEALLSETAQDAADPTVAPQAETVLTEETAPLEAAAQAAAAPPAEVAQSQTASSTGATATITEGTPASLKVADTTLSEEEAARALAKAATLNVRQGQILQSLSDATSDSTGLTDRLAQINATNPSQGAYGAMSLATIGTHTAGQNVLQAAL